MIKQKQTVATFSSGIANKNELKILLGVDHFKLKPTDSESIDCVVGWGRKENTLQARAFAQQHQLDYYSLEDGFIHSMGQGVLGASSCSLVKDRTGIYYDATQSSDLESLLVTHDETYFNPQQIERAKDAIQRITRRNITKYNNGVEHLEPSTIDKTKKIVLLIDQTAGDMSLKYGFVDGVTFESMLKDALQDYPDAQIIIKTHPDVVAGKKKGHLNLQHTDGRISVISDYINPLVLLKKVDVVYVATSQMGFEALMLGKSVICYGVPFYAGWGLTEDKADRSLSVWARRTSARTLEDLFVAAYIHYSTYMHPDTQQICDLEEVLSYFELQLNSRIETAQKMLFCINFTRWKQNYIKAFLRSDDSLVFISSAKQAISKGFDSSSQLVSWASKDPTEVNKLIEQFDVDVWQIEDGFIRSAGLGTDLTAPASLVLDTSGIYYDPETPSDLEKILQNKEFTEAELERADTIKNLLLKNELSKYNLGTKLDTSAWNIQKDQKIILVPGQVEGDASIKKGCIDVNTNTGLIQVARKNSPNAYLIYKPHPDVVSGNRKGGVDDDVLQECCDQVVLDASITDCLAVADEVHTMTSLVGFEGLLRSLKVVCYGLPFYSNWGLTEDHHQLERRTRSLRLTELVAGTLIEYPRYVNWQTGGFTTPEVVITQIKNHLDQQGGKQKNQVFKPWRQVRKIKNIVRGFIPKKY